MFVVNISSLINKNSHFNMLIILNIFLLIPLSLIILNNDKENKSNIKCNIITTILYYPFIKLSQYTKLYIIPLSITMYITNIHIPQN